MINKSCTNAEKEDTVEYKDLNHYIYNTRGGIQPLFRRTIIRVFYWSEYLVSSGTTDNIIK